MSGVPEVGVGASRPLIPAERLKAFTDGVVAIAITLLILPLMEGVGELGREGRTVLEYLDEDRWKIGSFAMSFLVIATFWVIHHRNYDRVHRVTSGLTWLTIAWMFTIVWLPVPTAMLGAMPTDAVQKTLYIGSMLLTAVIMLLTRVYLSRHTDLHDIPPVELRAGVYGEAVVCVLFAAALAVAVLVPGIGYNAMFLLLLAMPLRGVAGRLSRRDR